MGLDLNLVPEVVKPLALPLTGGAFPETDIDGAIASAQTLEDLADLLAKIKSDDAAAVVRLLRGYAWQGAAKETFEQVFKVLGGQPEADGSPSDETLIDLLEKALRKEAAALREHGVRMQHTEWMIYASLALLGAMIVKLLVWIYVNGPAVLKLIQYNTLLTQVNIQTLKRLVLVNMLKFAGIMGGLDLGVQVAQQIWGDREAGDFDLASLAMSFGSGALTGALFAGANAALSRLLSRRMVYVASEAELAVRDKIAAIAQSMYGQALLGGTAGTAGALPGLALSGQLDGKHLAYTFISGVAGGLDVPASARTSYFPMRAVAELGDAPTGSPPRGDSDLLPVSAPRAGTDPPPFTAPRYDADPPPLAAPRGDSDPPPPSGGMPASPPSPRLVPHDATALAQYHPRPEHADVGALINRQPPEPGANLPQQHSGQVIVGEVTRRHDVLLHSPAGDRAEPGGSLARPQQHLPAARAPLGDAAPAVPRAEPAASGGLLRTSLLPATVPALITPTPDDAGAVDQDNRQGQESTAPGTAETAPTTHERPRHPSPDDAALPPHTDESTSRARADDSVPPTRTDDAVPPARTDDAVPPARTDDAARGDGTPPPADPQVTPGTPQDRTVPAPDSPQHARTDLEAVPVTRAAPLPDNPRRFEPVARRVADLLSRDGAYDPISGPAWEAAHTATVERLMDSMRSSTKDLLGVGRKRHLRAALGDPAVDLVQSEVRVLGTTSRSWTAVDRSAFRSFVDNPGPEAEGPRRIISRMPFDSPEAQQTARRLAVEDLMKIWAQGGRTMRSDLLALHLAALDEFGPTQAVDLTRYDTKAAGKVQARAGDTLRDFLRQQYEETQRELELRGIEELVLYRGITFDPYTNPVPSLAEAANGDVVPAPPALPLQSWTAMPGVAKRYTGLADGAVMAGVFPASQVLSTPWTGMGQLPLNEFVLLATPGEVTVLRPPHVDASAAYPDIPVGWQLSKPGDGWVRCEQGHRHWGTKGGAGLLLFHRAPGGEVQVLMQLRSLETQHGGTLGLPGGALRPGEDPVDGGFREVGEENRLDRGEVEVRGVHHDDHGGWAYSTVIGEISHLADVWPASHESLDNVWVPLDEVPQLNLHPDLARAWPEVRTELDRVLTPPAPGRPHPAETHQVPSFPETGEFAPIADPRPRNFAEAAAIVHRWTPDNGRPGHDGPRNDSPRQDAPRDNGPSQDAPGQDGPRQDPPPNRIEQLLSNPQDRTDPPPPAVPDGELLAEGRRLMEELPVIDESDTTAIALASMGRALGEANPRRTLHDVARELGLNADLDALVAVFDDARQYGLNPGGAAGRTALTGVLRQAMAADSYRWTGYRHQSLFSIRDATAAEARAIGLLLGMMGDPVTSTKVRNFVKPVLDGHGLRDARQVLPAVRAAHEKGYLPAGTTGDAAFHEAMRRFWQDDPYLWDGLLLAERYSLTDLLDPTARLAARMEEIIARPGDTRPLERLAGDVGQGSVEQLVHLAKDAQAQGADLARAADRQDLVDRITEYRARDPHLWDGLRIADEYGITRPSDDAARVLSRLAEVTGSERPSRMWALDPLRRLARDAGFDHSVEQLLRQAVTDLPQTHDLSGPLDRQQVLDAVTRDTGRRPGPLHVPPGLHDLSPSAVRDARQAAVHEHARARQAFQQAHPALSRTLSRLTGTTDPLVMAQQERVASLEARTQAWQRWPELPEVSFTRDFAAYRRAYEQAVERAVRGEAMIPYMTENATASLGARDGGRGFGLEIEFDLPKHLARQARQAIAHALRKAGLTGDAQVHAYHSMQDQGYRSGKNGGRGLWRLELDGTVEGELVSPILYDEPATWENLHIAIGIIRAHGGTTSSSTGGHIHVSTHDYDHIVENYTSVLNYTGHHTDTLYRLGHNPEQAGHRGLKHCHPNPLPTAGYTTIAPVRNFNSSHNFGVNMASMKGSAKDHVEFRMYDGSLDAAVIQSHVKVSLAVVEAAFRNATTGELPNLGRHDRLGTHADLFRRAAAPDLSEQGSLSFRILMDELFWRAADKEQLAALFAATRWAPAA
ncbi:NUDIX domain-containing protein [Nonomuraea sp. NPDC050153]|uniref:NUDIX domain-containing protein n=1 Tax=Nonomuraea sp. NPDC050153 TaxID=3364359 RepID=UPI00378DF25C